MNRQEILEDIRYIKEVISSSTHYTNLSGIAAIISGVAALTGCLFTGLILRGWQISAIPEHKLGLVVVWACVFLLSAILHLYFIRRKAQETRQPAWSRLARLIVYSFCPPVLIGGLLTGFLVWHSQFSWIPGIWMITYGLGVWSGGLFSVSEPRWLGAAFMITGVVVLFFLLDYSLWMIALTFGLYHIVYGIRLYSRYGG